MLECTKAVIKVDAHTKGNNMEAKGSALADYYVRQAAPTGILTLLIHQETKSLERFKRAIIDASD